MNNAGSMCSVVESDTVSTFAVQLSLCIFILCRLLLHYTAEILTACDTAAVKTKSALVISSARD